MNIHLYWQHTLAQNAVGMKSFFCDNAVVNFHNTNEQFTADEFIKINCLYPGNWNGDIKRVEILNDLIITVVHVYSDDLSFHTTSFIKLKNDKISQVDEYWSEDGEMPQWRKDLKIGTKIK